VKPLHPQVEFSGIDVQHHITPFWGMYKNQYATAMLSHAAELLMQNHLLQHYCNTMPTIRCVLIYVRNLPGCRILAASRPWGPWLCRIGK
jgi:hypothetical protein